MSIYGPGRIFHSTPPEKLNGFLFVWFSGKSFHHYIEAFVPKPEILKRWQLLLTDWKRVRC